MKIKNVGASEPRGAAGAPAGRAAIQRDKARPGKWANGNLVISSWDKCEVPHPERCRLGTARLGSSAAGRAPRRSRLGTGQQGCTDHRQHPGLQGPQTTPLNPDSHRQQTQGSD